MKRDRIESAAFSNRKKTIHVEYASGRIADVHYGQLGLSGNLSAVWVDRETCGMTVGLRAQSGREHYMPYDQPLALTRDPGYLLQTHIERLLSRIEAAMGEKGMSKRYLAAQLGTSDNQIHRLLNRRLVNKNLGQLYKIASLVGLELEWHVKDAA